jgi:CRISPR/Cas system-associated endonuclease Cas1
MKKKPNVVLSNYNAKKLKRRDIIQQEQLYMVTLDGKPITIAVIDEDLSRKVTPRYTNTVFSQRQSAENAVAKLNAEFYTQRFVVKQVKLTD